MKPSTKSKLLLDSIQVDLISNTYENKELNNWKWRDAGGVWGKICMLLHLRNTATRRLSICTHWHRKYANIRKPKLVKPEFKANRISKRPIKLRSDEFQFEKRFLKKERWGKPITRNDDSNLETKKTTTPQVSRAPLATEMHKSEFTFDSSDGSNDENLPYEGSDVPNDIDSGSESFSKETVGSEISSKSEEIHKNTPQKRKNANSRKYPSKLKRMSKRPLRLRSDEFQLDDILLKKQRWGKQNSEDSDLIEKHEMKRRKTQQVKTPLPTRADIIFDSSEYVSDEMISNESSDGLSNIEVDTYIDSSLSEDTDNEEIIFKTQNTNHISGNTTNGDHKSFSFSLTNEEWLRISPTKGNSGLKKGWTELFYQKFHDKISSCVISFTYNRVRKTDSRKKTSHFFLGKAKCKFSTCTTFNFVIHDPPLLQKDVLVEVSCNGDIHHEESKTHKRHMKGERRVHIVEDSKLKGPSTVHLERLSDMTNEEIKFGNLSHCSSASVLRKAVSETKSKQKLHSDPFSDLVLVQEMLKENDDESNTTRGYIQYISYDPFVVIAYSESQLLLLKREVERGSVSLYLDATGSVVQNMNGRRVLYYAIIMPGMKGQSPVPVAEMLSSDQTTVVLSLFLTKVMHSFRQYSKSIRNTIHKVETDFSWALISAAVMSFNYQHVSEYIRDAWRYFTLGMPFRKTVLHICACHLIKKVYERLSHVTKDKGLTSFVTFSFGLIQNSKDPKSAKVILKDLLTVLLKESDCPCVVEAVAKLQQRISTMEFQHEQSQTDLKGCSHDDPQDLKKKKSIRDESPFKNFFNLDTSCSCSSTTFQINRFNCKDAAHIVCDYMPLYPLWSGMLLLDRTRDTNAPVENWFKMVKLNILQGKKRLAPGMFLRSMHKSLRGRVRQKEIGLSKEASRGRLKSQNQERDISPTMSQEKWGEKRSVSKTPKRSKFYSVPKIIPSPKMKSQIKTKPQKNEMGLRNKMVGLTNSKGNSCWLNTSIQTVIAMIENDDKNMLSEDFADTTLAKSVIQTIVAVKSTKKAVSSVEQILDVVPSASLEEVGIQVSAQNDAADFTDYILLLLGQQNLIETLDLNYLNSCSYCGAANKPQPDQLYMWPVEIPGYTRQHLDVQACIEECMKSETLVNEDAPLCNTCGKKTPHVRNSQVENAPTFLCIRLKRFGFSQEKKTSKILINRMVTLPTNGFIANYKLLTIQCHNGRSCNSGHYTCVRVVGDRIYMLDDTRITTRKQSFLDTDFVKESAYVVIYNLSEENATGHNRISDSEDGDTVPTNQLSSVGEIVITDADLESLKRGHWLNDNVVNAYLNLLEKGICKRRGDDNYAECMDTFVFTKLSQRNSDVTRYTRIKSLRNAKVAVFPIHMNKHWAAVIASRKRREILFYDSLALIHTKSTESIKCLLAEIWGDKDAWSVKVAKEFPLQTNDSDCGVFMCMFVRDVLWARKPSFTQDQVPSIRHKMAQELTKGELQ